MTQVCERNLPEGGPDARAETAIRANRPTLAIVVLDRRGLIGCLGHIEADPGRHVPVVIRRIGQFRRPQCAEAVALRADLAGRAIHLSRDADLVAELGRCDLGRCKPGRCDLGRGTCQPSVEGRAQFVDAHQHHRLTRGLQIARVEHEGLHLRSADAAVRAELWLERGRLPGNRVVGRNDDQIARVGRGHDVSHANGCEWTIRLERIHALDDARREFMTAVGTDRHEAVR